MPWNPGDHITLRWVGHRSWLDEKNENDRTGILTEKPGLLQAWPHIVVEDRDDLLAVWMPAGTATQLLDLSQPGSAPIPSVWRRDRLSFMFPDRPYSIAFDWTPEPDREFVKKPRALYAEMPEPSDYFTAQPLIRRAAPRTRSSDGP